MGPNAIICAISLLGTTCLDEYLSDLVLEARGHGTDFDMTTDMGKSSIRGPPKQPNDFPPH